MSLMHPPQTADSSRFLRFCGWLCLFLPAACATVDPKPFAQYQTAVREAQAGIDAAMAVNYQWARAAYVDRIANAPEAKFSQMVLQVEGGYKWSIPNEPVHFSVKRAREALAEMNGAFARYADLLAQLADPKAVDPDHFEKLAQDLNQNLRDAAKAFDAKANTEGLALFSVASIELARLYIEHQRQDHLRALLGQNQVAVDAYAQHCVGLLHLLRGGLKKFYVDRQEPLERAWRDAAGDKRQKPTEAMVTLNEQFIDSLAVLQELERAYQALPVAHAGLGKAIERPGAGLDGLQALLASAKRLQRLYGELKKTET